MLPDSLRGSYTIYKEDTDSVAAWLASTAKQCGYPLDLLTTPGGDLPSQKGSRTKGKARKLAKTTTSTNGGCSESARSGSTTYIIAIKDFIPLAEHIVAYQTPSVKVPTTLVKSLDRAIALRQKHNSWFDDVGRTSKGNGHSYFLGVLEQVREILRRCMPPDTAIDPMPQPLAGLNADATSRTHICNAFMDLSLNDIRDKYSDLASILKNSKLLTKFDDEARYRVENFMMAEVQYLAVHCLSTDIDLIIQSTLRLFAAASKENMSLMDVCKTKRTAAGIPTWSPTVVLICRSTAYVWQSGRDAQFSADC
ncbi:hypothetical protein KCU67_g7535, partial [Aureobasidium melanogenum]